MQQPGTGFVPGATILGDGNIALVDRARGSCAVGSAPGGLIARPTAMQQPGTGFISGATILGDGNIALILHVD